MSPVLHLLGLDIITKKKMNHLQRATVGNPSMHPWFHIPTWLGCHPGHVSAASWMMRQEIAKLDFPPVGEFMQMIVDSGRMSTAARCPWT